MEFIDARRLTGPSLLFDLPGSILDVACTAEEAAQLEPAWEKHLQRMLDAVGWHDCEFASIRLTGGISLGFTAPIDALYAASEIHEWVWAACDAELNGAQKFENMGQRDDAAVVSMATAVAFHVAIGPSSVEARVRALACMASLPMR